MSVKVDLKQFRTTLDKVFTEVTSQKNMREFGEYAVDRIVKRTRLGKGVDERGGDPKPLKALSESYKKKRRTSEELSSTTRPGKSNLTFTGQLLDSIKVITIKAGSVLISATGRRKDGLTNKELTGYVSEDRPFLNLSKPELNGLSKLIRERIESILKRK